jgi:hypothetical protein
VHLSERQTGDVQGVLLDVRGVFVVPSRDRLVETLGDLIGSLSDAACERAHFEGIHALDVQCARRDGQADNLRRPRFARCHRWAHRRTIAAGQYLG